MSSYSNIERPLQEHLKKGSTPLIKRIGRNNQFILHNYLVPISNQCTCPLTKCQKKFNIKLIPNQIVYPKYCSAHRTEHRRNIFLSITG